MISTFDLTLMGSLVSAGGLLFLRRGKWPHPRWSWLDGRQSGNQESRDRWERSATMAGARWLTLGALTLFVGCTHGAEEGYLFGPWSDVTFHIVFVSAAWGMTAYRMKQAAQRSTGQTTDSPLSALSLPHSRSSQTGN